MFVHPDFLSGLFAPMEKAPHQETRYGGDPQLEMSRSVWGTILQSTVVLQAPHCVQWMKRPCT